MAPVLRLVDGMALRLDRRLCVEEVVQKVNEARGVKDGPLLAFENDATPSQTLYVDAAAVIAVVERG